MIYIINQFVKTTFIYFLAEQNNPQSKINTQNLKILKNLQSSFEGLEFFFRLLRILYIFSTILYYQMLLELLLGVIIILAITIAYKYYYKPRAEIKRYSALFRSLGYKVYEYPFSFMGLAFKDAEDKGVELHRDAQYLQKTVFPQIDVAICNCVEKVLIFIVNPDLMQEFFSGNRHLKFPKLETMISGLQAVIGQGLSFSEGESWKRKRKLMSKIFNFDLITLNIPKMVEICNKCFDKYEANHMISENMLKINNFKMASGIFNGVMMKCFFGNDYINDTIGDGKNYPEFILDTIAEASDLTLDPFIAFLGQYAWKLGITPKIRELNERVRLMRLKATQILKERTEQVMKAPRKQKCTDIIEALVYEKLDNKEEFTYSDSQLIDEYQSFVVAGTDTATRYFSMILFTLGNHPDVHKRVRDQVNAIIKSDEDITPENIKKLTYIDWLQHEITRMYGPVNGILYREAIVDDFIKDVPITKGTMISTQPLGNHFNPKYFKDPQVFRPERWENQCDGIHPCAFMGFSFGARSCIGKQLAHTQSKVAIIKLIKRYETIEVPKEVTMHLKFMYEPEPFDVKLTKVPIK